MSLVGRRGPEWRFPIEWSKVWEFAKAVRDDHAELQPLPVPPLFPIYGHFAFETFFGSIEAGMDLDHVLHAQEEYEYRRPLRVGDRLVCQSRIIDEYYRDGRRGGRLHFIVTETEMREEATGELVVTERTTMVQSSA